ncbi:YigZ family protein [Enterococcus hirae]|nr:YigZ family protein [Enterococcaceae bacterium]MCI1918733.1 YigZ family protein [Enterococcaceae bacterium]MDM8214174.1 YigZ family protein [Enterococcus hirae]
MIDHYFTLAKDGQHELEIKKSRFLCTLKRLQTEEEAKEAIHALKKEHYRANHNCSAFILGKKAEVQRSSDDGEPSGTAGMPILEVLRKNQLVDVLAVVTRYFGGIKLGAGGLIRAYSNATSTALETLGIVEAKLQQELLLTIDYSQQRTFEHFLAEFPDVLKETRYTEKIDYVLSIDEAEIPDFRAKIIDLLSGKVQITLGEKGYREIPVKNHFSR